jgi:hypothetical protein
VRTRSDAAATTANALETPSKSRAFRKNDTHPGYGSAHRPSSDVRETNSDRTGLPRVARHRFPHPFRRFGMETGNVRIQSPDVPKERVNVTQLGTVIRLSTAPEPFS